MVHISVIQSQLTQLGVKLSRWFTPELKELQQILMDNEKIVAAAPGRYFGGYALLVATDLRILLIDKRTFFMTVEDIRYDMVSEIDFSSRVYDATVHLFTLNKQHNFTSMKYKKQLRHLCGYAQQRIWDLRQYQGGEAPPAPASAQVAAAAPVPAMPPQPAPAAPLASQAPTYPPPLATTTERIAQPEVHHALHLPKPHLPKHIGFAAVNGSRRFTPNAYTNHLQSIRSRSFAQE